MNPYTNAPAPDEQDSYYAGEQEEGKFQPAEKTAQQIIDDIEYARKAAERYCRKNSLIQKQQS